MELKFAKIMTNSFTQNGETITPALSDDWTYSFGSFYNSDDKIILRSEKLNLTVSITMGVQSFFNNFIYTKKIIIDGNRLIGNIAFNKYNIYLEDDFNEALRVVEDSEMYETIDNDELIEFGVYLDDKGEEFVYLGNMAYDIVYLDVRFNIKNEKKSKKRYISKYTNNSISYNNPIIQKNGKRKFIEFVRNLTINERETFLSDLFSSSLYNIFLISRENGNDLNILLKEETIHYPAIIKYNGTYGFYVPGDIWTRKECSFHTLDFKLLCKDIKNNSLLSLDNYFIKERKKFFIAKEDKVFKVKFYLDYV